MQAVMEIPVSFIQYIVYSPGLILWGGSRATPDNTFFFPEIFSVFVRLFDGLPKAMFRGSLMATRRSL
jgi:hypothetical protein